jgi:hypothetical protein
VANFPGAKKASDTKPFSIFLKTRKTSRKIGQHIFIATKKYDQKFNDSTITNVCT